MTQETGAAPYSQGDLNCQGAIFIYKDDNSVEKAWQAAAVLSNQHSVRAELHCTKETFLPALAAWSKKARPRSSMLMLYAHMGAPGINSFARRGTSRVTWPELASHLGDGVHTLWLIGCTSTVSTTVWSSLTAPVRGYLLATTAKAPFAPFLPLFAEEISLQSITPYDRMLERLASLDPKLGKLVTYFYPTASGWKPGIRPSRSPASYSGTHLRKISKLIQKELSAAVPDAAKVVELSLRLADAEVALRTEAMFYKELEAASKGKGPGRHA